MFFFLSDPDFLDQSVYLNINALLQVNLVVRSATPPSIPGVFVIVLSDKAAEDKVRGKHWLYTRKTRKTHEVTTVNSVFVTHLKLGALSPWMALCVTKGLISYCICYDHCLISIVVVWLLRQQREPEAYLFHNLHAYQSKVSCNFLSHLQSQNVTSGENSSKDDNFFYLSKCSHFTTFWASFSTEFF